MRYKFVVVVFLALCMGLQANVDITSIKNINQINQGLSYLAEQEGKETETVKLKKYSLSQVVKKPSLFGSYDAIYTLYLAGFLQNARPYWLEDDRFIFHTSSNKKYLKRLQKIYLKKYNIKLSLDENKQFRQDRFKLRKIHFDDLKDAMNSRISLYFANKKQKRKKRVENRKIVKHKDKNLTVIPAKIATKSEIKNTQKGLRYLENQKKEEVKSIKAKKYILAKKVEKPSFFSSKEPIYNLYLTSILNKGKPAWLENGKFIFHTSSNKRYLKRLQNIYKKRYHIETAIYGNIKKEPLPLQNIDYDALIAYISARMPVSQKKKNVQKKEEKKNITKQESKHVPIERVHLAEVKTKRDIKNLQRGIAHLEKSIEHKNDKVKLQRYFLAKVVEKPSFFSSMKPIYNLYMIAILNQGYPQWLDDDTFVFHSARSKTYLKRLQKMYQKRYNLDTVIYETKRYQNDNIKMKELSFSKVLDYLHNQLPETSVQQITKSKPKKLVKKKQENYLLKKRLTREKKAGIEKKRKQIKTKQKQLDRKIELEKNSLAAKKRALEEERRQLEKERKKLEEQKRLLKEREKAKETLRLEAKKQKKKRLEEEKRKKEQALKAEQKRLLKENEQLLLKIKREEKKRLEEEKRKKEQALKAEQKRIEEQKRLAAKEKEVARKKKLAEKLEAEKQVALAAKKKAEAKKKKEDALTSELDKMLQETSEFKKKLERSESIKYY